MPAPNAAATRNMLAALWKRSLPATQVKLAVLESAVAAAATGALTDELRHQACGEAHKLAGSLGMFGYPHGTDLARQIEQHLDGNAPVDAKFLRKLTTGLHAELFPKTK